MFGCWAKPSESLSSYHQQNMPGKQRFGIFIHDWREIRSIHSCLLFSFHFAFLFPTFSGLDFAHLNIKRTYREQPNQLPSEKVAWASSINYECNLCGDSLLMLVFFRAHRWSVRWLSVILDCITNSSPMEMEIEDKQKCRVEKWTWQELQFDSIERADRRKLLFASARPSQRSPRNWIIKTNVCQSLEHRMHAHGPKLAIDFGNTFKP